MTLNQAINEARDRIYMHYSGGGYTISRHDETVDAVRCTNGHDYWGARAAVRESRIALALELAGIYDREAAEYFAYQRDPGGRWERVVRDIAADAVETK